KCLRVYADNPRTSGFMTSDCDGFGMSGQSFGNGKLFDHLPETFDGSARITNNARAFEKIRYAQWRKKTRRTIRRQHVTWPCKIIANHGGRITANENGACIFDVVGHIFGLRHQYFHMLGSNMVNQSNRIVLVADDEG